MVQKLNNYTQLQLKIFSLQKYFCIFKTKLNSIGLQLLRFTKFVLLMFCKPNLFEAPPGGVNFIRDDHLLELSFKGDICYIVMISIREQKEFKKFSIAHQMGFNNLNNIFAQFGDPEEFYAYMSQPSNYQINFQTGSIVLKWKITGHQFKRRIQYELHLLPEEMNQKQKLQCQVITLRRKLADYEIAEEKRIKRNQRRRKNVKEGIQQNASQDIKQSENNSRQKSSYFSRIETEPRKKRKYNRTKAITYRDKTRIIRKREIKNQYSQRKDRQIEKQLQRERQIIYQKQNEIQRQMVKQHQLQRRRQMQYYRGKQKQREKQKEFQKQTRSKSARENNLLQQKREAPIKKNIIIQTSKIQQESVYSEEESNQEKNIKMQYSDNYGQSSSDSGSEQGQGQGQDDYQYSDSRDRFEDLEMYEERKQNVHNEQPNKNMIQEKLKSSSSKDDFKKTETFMVQIKRDSPEFRCRQNINDSQDEKEDKSVNEEKIKDSYHSSQDKSFIQSQQAESSKKNNHPYQNKILPDFQNNGDEFNQGIKLEQQEEMGHVIQQPCNQNTPNYGLSPPYHQQIPEISQKLSRELEAQKMMLSPNYSPIIQKNSSQSQYQQQRKESQQVKMIEEKQLSTKQKKQQNKSLKIEEQRQFQSKQQIVVGKEVNYNQKDISLLRSQTQDLINNENQKNQNLQLTQKQKKQLQKKKKSKSKIRDRSYQKIHLYQNTYQIKFQNGDFYEGQLQNLLFHGYGKYFSISNGIYEGYWKQGMAHGQGKSVDIEGNMYCGAFEKDIRHGYGEDTYSNGQVYKGNFIRGSKNGQGTYKYKNGDYYQGQWLNDMCHGRGKEYSTNGTSYEGFWVQDLRQGEGIYHSLTGDFKHVYSKGKIISQEEIVPTNQRK